MDQGNRRELLEHYRQGPRAVRGALAGISEQELDRRPGPDEWSPRQIVHHLADMQLTGAVRLRRLIAEDQPTIENAEEGEYAQRLHYDRPIESSLATIDAVHASCADLLESLGEAEWRREGTHSLGGRYSVDIWLTNYAAHANDHAAQIRRARETGK